LESFVLTLTQNASTIVKEIAGQPDPGGLRIASGGPGEPALQVTRVGEPETGDQVIEQGGATVYLDGPASRELEDKVRDATVDRSGKVQFTLSLQS